MSLDGLRAWIGEVERKLGKRTRVFLALSTIAIGIGGAAIYLAIDTREGSVSEADVQELQEQLEARIGAGGGEAAGTSVAGVEAELNSLQAEVAALKRRSGTPPEKGRGDSGEGGRGDSGNATGGASTGTSESVPPSGASEERPGDPADQARLKKLLERAKEQAEQAEGTE